ncbi:MAG: ABC transporter ATP-binding protein [Dehalococcoidia bacterium]|nr:ABC transporter ATP-binding protein [Dehalococcoidia bacterium]
MTGSRTSTPTISVDGVSRWFGNIVAVNDVSFNIFPGITALLGPNGAGKTTLLRMVGGLGDPSDGGVRVLGDPVRRNPAIFSRIGVMTEHESVYEFLTGRELVELNARLHRVPDVMAAVDEAIELVDLAADQHRRLGGYSRGMRQRMRLAATLVHSPEVLLLDEPLSGTDPPQRLRFMEVMRRIARQGRTIVISSHILEEVETLADRIILLTAGKVAAAGEYRAIRQKLNEQPYLVRVEADQPRVLGAGLMAIDAVESVEVDEDDRLHVRSREVTELQRALPHVARDTGVRILRVEPLDDSLESLFEYLAQQQWRGRG